MILKTLTRAAFAVAALVGSVSAIDLDIHDEDSIKNAAAIAALNTMAKYTGNQTGHIPGKLPGEWAMGGMLFDTMIQYWYFTGDSSNNPAVSQGMYAQRGEQEDYFPANWSSWMGNDDQMQWGLAAMTAAELEFPQESSMPSWVTLAENVFNDMVPRWDNKTCGGGLRWQIYPYQSGYSIKSSASNGEFFQLAARLARYTNNQSYADWAERIWDWSTKSLLLNTNKWNLGDSLDATMDCSRGDAQWTYNYGAYISGAAYMYNVTKDEKAKWKSGLDGLLNTTFHTFFPQKYGGKIMSEVNCEPKKICSDGSGAFKGALASDLAFVTVVAPYTASDIMPRLQGSAKGAAKACAGGKSDQNLCGQRWYSDYDGTENIIARQISATSIFTSNLVIYKSQDVATEDTADTSTASSTTGAAGAASSSASASTTSSTDGNGASALDCGWMGVNACIVAAIVAMVQAFV